MKYPFGKLTHDQIKQTFFAVPEIGILLGFGKDYLLQFKSKRAAVEADGGELLMIGWPDGNTITLRRTDPSHALDLDRLVALYQMAAAFRPENLDAGVK